MGDPFRCPPPSGWEGAGQAHGFQALGFKTDKKAVLQLPRAIEQSLTIFSMLAMGYQ